MYMHTFGITLKNGDKGEIVLQMPSKPDDALWMDRCSMPDPSGQVNELAVRNWTIACQAMARKASTMEAAQDVAEAFKFGERASPVQKPTTVSKDLGWTDEMLAELAKENIQVV